jgi:hypothetical protein
MASNSPKALDQNQAAEPHLFSQHVEDNALHLSIYVLISGGGWSSVMPVSIPRRSLLCRTL